MTKQDFIDAFILLLSGAAKMKNEKEMWWKNGGDEDITLEFPTDTPEYVIIRKFYSDGSIEWTQNHHPSEKGNHLHGEYFEYYQDGKLIRKGKEE